jgi:hypothetical protein
MYELSKDMCVGLAPADAAALCVKQYSKKRIVYTHTHVDTIRTIQVCVVLKRLVKPDYTAYTYTHTYTNTNTHTHANTHTHTHAYTHTYINSCVYTLYCLFVTRPNLAKPYRWKRRCSKEA